MVFIPFRLRNQKWDTYNLSGTQLWLVRRASSFALMNNLKTVRRSRMSDELHACAVLMTRGVHGNENRKNDCLSAVCGIKSIHE